MGIELELTIKEARKIERLLREAKDPALVGIQTELTRWIGVHDARIKQAAPWRKVVKHEHYPRHIETLECGHLYSMRTSKNWVEDDATRRRCEQCAAAASKTQAA